MVDLVVYIYRQRQFQHERILQTLCTALIQSLLDYSCSSCFLFFVLFCFFGFVSSFFLFFLLSAKWKHKLKWCRTRSFVFKIYHEKAPENLKSHFWKFSNIPRYSTRGSTTYFILTKVKGQLCNAFFFTGIKEWNSVPNHFKSSKTHLQFQKTVKSHLVISIFIFFIICDCLTRKCNDICV